MNYMDNFRCNQLMVFINLIYANHNVSNQNVSFSIENGQKEYVSKTIQKDAKINNVYKKKSIQSGGNFNKKCINNMINVN